MPETARKYQPLFGAVLSGGKSSRMGKPKDRIILPSGKSMLQHQIDILLAFCNEVVVAGPELPLSHEETERVHFVRDQIPGNGPLSGIEAVLSTGISSAFLILACDQPLLNESILRLLIPEERELPCFFKSEGEELIQPFPGFYPLSWLPEIRDALHRNRLALKYLIQESNAQYKQIDKKTAFRLRSANSPEELAQLIEEFDFLQKQV